MFTAVLSMVPVFVGVFFLQDLERRENELNELRHLLEENHTAVTKWKTDAVEKDKVFFPSKQCNNDYNAVLFYILKHTSA